MATDYDAPRKGEDENLESIEELKSTGSVGTAASPNIDEVDAADSFDLPGAEVSGDEELAVRVVPAQDDEFVCASCFLVHHRSQIARRGANAELFCTECEDA